MRIDREVSGFSLIEVLIAVVVLATALVPIAMSSITQSNTTSHISAYVNVMHTSGTILNRLLKEVPYMEVVKDFNLPSGEVEVTVADLRALKFGTPEVEIFAGLGLQAPEDSGGPLGTCNYINYSYRDEAMAVTDAASAHKVYYSMKVKRLNRTFNMWKNNITNPSAPPTEANTQTVLGDLMKITLTAEWTESAVYRDSTADGGQIRQRLKPYQYSLVTMKANLTE